MEESMMVNVGYVAEAKENEANGAPAQEPDDNEGVLFTCEICYRVFRNERKWIKHKKHHEKSPKKKSKKNRKKAKDKGHTKLKRSGTSGAEEVKASRKKTSKKRQHSTSSLACLELDCVYIAPTLDALRQHRKRKHNPDKEDRPQSPKPCFYEDCDYVGPSSDALSKHISRNHNPNKKLEPVVQCDFDGCGYIGSKDAARHHVTRNHNNANKTVSSIVAPKKSESEDPSNLQPIKPRSRSRLQTFKCEQCNKGFSSTRTLRNHISIHSDEKKYKCFVEECDFAGSTTGEVKVHIQTQHPPESKPGKKTPAFLVIKKFSCPYCPKEYYSAKRLDYHQVLEHPSGEYIECPDCQCKYGDQEALDKHKCPKSN